MPTDAPSRRSLPLWLLVGLTLTWLTTVLLSWCASALGYDVTSVLTGEGLRHFFRLPSVAFATWHGEVFLLVLLAVGALSESRCELLPRRHPSAWWAAATVVLTGIVLLLLTVAGADAPLRSAAGHVLPSPFGMGFARALTLITVLASMVYARVSGARSSWVDAVPIAWSGLTRYAPWLAVWVMAEIVYATFVYVFH